MQLKNIIPSVKTKVLAVDDNPASLKIMEIILGQDKNYEVITAVNGRVALEILLASPDEIDIILLDRIMPEMDGIEFCKRIKADKQLRTIPVIMQTAAGRPQDIKEGIEAGVFYYLVKPLIAETLMSILASARNKVKRYRRRHNELMLHNESMAMVQSMKCTYRTLEEAETLSAFLARFFPNPDLAIAGICELLINAVEHGNLAISFEEKTALLRSNQWQQEVTRRLNDALYCGRMVTVHLEKNSEKCSLRIQDDGDGFDWKQYSNVDISWATLNHGRGIAMAKIMSFDKVVYNDKGNLVTASVFIS